MSTPDTTATRLTSLRPWRAADGTEGTKLYMWCPGCDDLHAVEVKDEKTRWEWDGNLEAPTISPSILVNGQMVYQGYNPPYSHRRCHSYVKAGQWEFLRDSQHSLLGQTVPMVPLPDWVFAEGEDA